MAEAGVRRIPRRPVLGITLGDPAGIGPEIVAKALATDHILDLCAPVVFGSSAVLRQALARFAPRVPEPIDTTDFHALPARAWSMVDTGQPAPDTGKVPLPGSAESGLAAYAAITAATRAALTGRIDAIVTAPVNKAALALAGHVAVGHTELLADLCGVPRTAVAMLLSSDTLRVAHVSTHVSLRDAIDSLGEQRIVDVALLAHAAVERSMGRGPRVAIAALNPHAGESGLFGHEEETTIRPAVDRLASLGMDVHGPVPADTAFVHAVNGRYDVVVAMYHDQGHIPAKLSGSHRTVNVTLGLPIPRTSVDHGTAYDIAWTGRASADGLVSAITMACSLVGS